MFLGVSKNIGGFRFGIGTSLNSKPSNKETKDDEFKKFLALMGEKAISSLKDFLNVSGYDLNELNKHKIDLDALYVGSKKYDEFVSLTKGLERTVQRIKELEDFGLVGKRKISNEVYKLEDFVSDYVKNYDKYLEDGLATKSIDIKQLIPESTEIKEEKPIIREETTQIKKESSILKKILKVLLIPLIIVAPFIFAWFTLLKGFSKTARILSFIWLLIFVLSISSQKDKNKEIEVAPATNIELKNNK
ncbi:hypothetical protein CRU92_10770 [Arcobacter sp. FW59]|nr:hypothetical protein CRU92_10770 [Arcobacter sp. FW59]